MLLSVFLIVEVRRHAYLKKKKKLLCDIDMFLIALCLPKFTCLNPMALSLRSNACSCCCELNLPQCTAPWISTCFFFFFFESPVQVRCIMLDAWGWCTGTTQGVGMGREEGGGFRMGNTCIPVADSF